MTDTTATDPTLPADGGPPARAVEQLVKATPAKKGKRRG